MGLAAILDDYVKSDKLLGIANRQSFELDLEAYRRSYALRSLAIFVCAMLLFAGAGYAAIRFIDDPAQLKLVYAATGVTLAGALETLRRVAREWGRVDLLLMLLKHADDEDATIIAKDLKAALKG